MSHDIAGIVGHLGSSLVAGSLLFALTLVLTALPPIRRRPRLVFFLWLVVLVRFLVPITFGADFSLQSLWLRLTGSAFVLDVGAVAPAATGAQAAAPVVAMGLVGWAFVAWLVGVALLGAQTLAAAVSTRVRLAAMAPAPESLVRRGRVLARAVGLRRVPRLLVGGRGPMALGVLSPTVTVPAWLLDSGELDHVLAHEFAHHRRRDPLLAIVARAAVVVFFFWPPVWWAASRLHLAREKACDRVAVTCVDGSARRYASALLSVTVAALASQRDGATALPMAARSDLSRRIDALVSARNRSRVSVGALGVVALGFQLAVGLPGADADTQRDYGALDCVVTPGLGPRILSENPAADRDGDGQLSRAEICAHQRRLQAQGETLGGGDGALMSHAAPFEPALDVCVEELRCSEPDLLTEARE